MTLIRQTYSTTTLDSKGLADDTPFRLVYADHVPVQEWTVWYAESLQAIFDQAQRRATQDLRADSGVYDNVFIIQRWSAEESGWVDENEDGEDLTDLCFDDDAS